MFSIHSNSSSRELVFSAYKGEYFHLQLKGEISASASVWAYTDASTLSDLFQELAAHEKPWQGERIWESIEGEFSISALCSPLGEVLFHIKLRGMPGAPEEWNVEAGLVTELGQLDSIAKCAAHFFKEPST